MKMTVSMATGAPRANRSIGAILMDSGVLTPEDAERVLTLQKEQGVRFGEAAIEETFVNSNPASALKLGLARGAAMTAPATAGLTVGEYPATLVKKSVVGTGHADKTQVQAMIKVLLPGITASSDAADALAVAICHSHHAVTKSKIGGIMAGGVR